MQVQRLILMSGLMGSIEANMNESLDEQSKTWMLQDLEGNNYQLSAFKDQPIFLNFWATWCPPCKAEMPAIESLKEKLDNNVHMLLVSYEEPDKVKAFLKKEEWDLPVYFPVTSIPEQLSAEALPTTFIISPEGLIVHRSKGMSDWSSSEVQTFILNL